MIFQVGSMLSNSSKYALKAVLYLAVNTDHENKMQVREISDNLEIPKAYTAKLMQQLARTDIISSSRGPKGGFYLSEENRNQSLMSVVEAIDGKIKLESCILGLRNCDEEKPCPLHFYINKSRDQLLQTLYTKSIEDMASDLREKKSFLPL